MDDEVYFHTSLWYFNGLPLGSIRRQKFLMKRKQRNRFFYVSVSIIHSNSSSFCMILKPCHKQSFNHQELYGVMLYIEHFVILIKCLHFSLYKLLYNRYIQISVAYSTYLLTQNFIKYYVMLLYGNSDSLTNRENVIFSGIRNRYLYQSHKYS